MAIWKSFERRAESSFGLLIATSQAQILGHSLVDLPTDRLDIRSRLVTDEAGGFLQRNDRGLRITSFFMDCGQYQQCVGAAILDMLASIVRGGGQNRMRAARPNLLARLFDPIATDRRGEVPEGGEPFMTIPPLSWNATIPADRTA